MYEREREKFKITISLTNLYSNSKSKQELVYFLCNKAVTPGFE